MLMGVDLCPAGYAYDKTTDECQENPLCSNSTFDPTQGKCCSCASTNTCLTTNSGSSYQCSADKCVDLAANPPTGTQTDLTYYHNNGTVTQNGCSAQIYIFNGKPEQCREAGTQTTWNNCCNPATGLFGANGGCDPLTDLATNADRNAGLCHLVDDSGGAYCMESWPVVGCVQRAEVYCCFKSKLARIIQEQGRKQFKTFGGVNGWGYVTWPDCRGFTPQEFQMIDMTKIDFSEWLKDLAGNINSVITNTIVPNATGAVQDFYNKIK
jgi:conjugal transfer mating pair stabilization protein TraN